MNKLLARQLRRNGVVYDALPEAVRKLLDDVSVSYSHHEADRSLIERSIDLSSQELIDANNRLREQSERQQVVLENLKEAVRTLPEHEQRLPRPDRIEEDDLIAISAILAGEIQKRHAAEDKWRVYERAIDSSRQGIVITDPTLPDNPLVFCNPGFQEITGYSAAEALGRNCRFLYGTERGQAGLEPLRSAIRERRSCSVVLKNFRKDGSPFWNELMVSPIFSADGELTHFVGIQNDITERINTDQRLGRLIENLHAGILVEDERRHILIVNQDFCTMFDIPVPPQVLVGTDCSQAAAQARHLFADPDTFVARIDTLLRDRKTVIGELLELADGRYFMRDFIPVTVDDEYRGHLWQYRDVTGQKRSEAELLGAKQTAEAALLARNDFFARMSHEIRTPLNGVVGVANLLAQARLSEDQQELVRNLELSAHNLAAIANDILELGKLGAGKIRLVPTELNLRDVLTRIVDSVRATAEQRGIALALQVDQELPERLRGDPVRLSQIVLNLVSNAIKFTEAGAVAISARKIGEEPSSVLVELQVRDTGVGIRPADLPHIFDAYVQAHFHLQEKFGGTGLGLPIVKQLVDLHGGTVEIASQPGLGTTVTVRLPLARAESHGPGAHDRSAESYGDSLRGRRFLLVEDNPVNQLVARRTLELLGASCAVAGSAQAGLAALRAEPFDLVLMDVQMPGMDGFEATRIIREELPYPACRIPVVAMTASVMLRARERCLAAGMDDYISKPFEIGELYATLERALGAREAYR